VLLLTLAQNENGLRMDAVVLHRIRRLVAPHEGLERLHVGDLGYQRALFDPPGSRKVRT
jgi:hypothetical protein